ncbi:hypothetical protein BDZ85DRAFT_1717 [Elsinoe ampelina]|uniref:Uncharacterized protein n=1 Tax=Elsinoe ampelina TaxID=302913 RepID=A0A6A6GNU8_9PEZI|nr:hypothetical protein BDZ85DRAFT_1717 [Elsinoe ampelina]
MMEQPLPSYNHTVTRIRLIGPAQVKENPFWDTTFQKLSASGSEAITWGSNKEDPAHLIIITEWPSTMTIKEEIEHMALALDPMDYLFASAPETHHCRLSCHKFRPMRHYLQELVLITGKSSLVTQEIISAADLFVQRVMPQIGHDPPIELGGYVRGITALEPGCESNTAVIIWQWVDESKRSRLVDPDTDSYGGASQYQEIIEHDQRMLEAAGVSITKVLLKLQRWFPPREPPKSRRCVIL